MSDRQTPSSPDAEKAALGCVLIRPAAWDELAEAVGDDFLVPIHREIFEAMRGLAGRRVTVDHVSLGDELKIRGAADRLPGGYGYLVELARAVGSVDSAPHYIRTVIAKATLRRTIAACADIVSSAYGPVDDVEEFLAETRAKLSAVEMRSAGGFVRMGDDMDKVLADIEGRGKDPDSYIVRTGLTELDAAIGGLRGSQLIAVGGNPGHGKTALAWEFMINAATTGIPGALVSLEMKRPEMIERAISKRARVDGRDIVAGRVDFEDWKRIQAPQTQDLRDLPVWINDRKLSARRICSEVRRWASRQASKMKLVVIDYLGLVRHEQEGQNRAREVGEMAEAFKALAKELDAPVVLCAQLNRENTKGGKDGKARPPVMSDFRDSGEIEQAADVVLFPWWEGTPKVGTPHPANIIIGKQRNGPQGSVKCQWEREFTTFSDRKPSRDYHDEDDSNPI